MNTGTELKGGFVDMEIIIVLILLVFLLMMVYSSKDSITKKSILNEWDSCVIFYTNTHKMDLWDLRYDYHQNFYYFQSRNGNVIDNEIFLSKLDGLNHLKFLEDKRIIKSFYINI